jgi:SpoIID/LytB domain protein
VLSEQVPLTHPPYTRLRGARLIAVLACATLSPAAAGAAAAAPAHASSLVIQGAGDGHGVGMSQRGALGFARHGWTYQAILAHYYSSTTLGAAPAKSTIKVLVGSKVLKLPLERYVRGVVAAEMPADWPAAALDAQAIASRTYALTSHAGGSRFDVYSDTRSQVYEGAAAETPATNAAVAATAGQIVLYHGKPATTYFFASSGGTTESIENGFVGSSPEPWLLGVSDPYESVSASSWKVTLSFTAVAARLRGILKGAFRGIEVLARGVSPRVVSALVLGSAGNTPVSGPELAGRLGLQSTWAYFSVRIRGHTKREPDRSGRSPGGVAPEPSMPPAPPSPGARGGTQAPVSAAGANAGGAVAGGPVAGAPPETGAVPAETGGVAAG